MKINKYHGKYNISKRTGSVKYIVCHYTGSGTSKAGNAKNNCIYFSGGNRKASAHYFIDDGGIWEYADPSKYYTWHCGDGHGKYGITNANSIGIEVCLDGDNPYTEKEIGYLQELVLYLMDEYDVPASRVVRHYDASRKMCPYYYARRTSEWHKLRSRITTKPKPAPKPKPMPKQPDSKPVNDMGCYYRAHVERAGWLSPVHDGMTAGTTGYSARCEAIKLSPPKGVVLDVKVHIQRKGWITYEDVEKGVNDPVMGTTGESLRMEAIAMKEVKNTTGKTMMYRAHVQGEGWQEWKTDGQIAGTTGKSLRLEAIQIKFV